MCDLERDEEFDVLLKIINMNATKMSHNDI